MSRRRDLARHLNRNDNMKETRQPMTPVVNCARKPVQLDKTTGTWAAATSNVCLGSNAVALQDETPEAFVARVQRAALNGATPRGLARMQPRKASTAAWARSRDKQRKQREYNDDLRLDTSFKPQAPATKSVTEKVGPTSAPQKRTKTVREREWDKLPNQRIDRRGGYAQGGNAFGL